MKKIKLLALTLLWIAGLLVGCSNSSVKLGWVESSSLKHITARYASFNGVERKMFRAEAGQAISITYDVIVEKGALVIKVMDPDGKILWEEKFREDTADIVILKSTQEGFNTMHIQGQETRGSFYISWNVGDE